MRQTDQIPPAGVVAFWGGFNLVMAIVLVGFSGTLVEYPIYLAAALLVLLNAGLVWLVLRRRHGRPPTWRQTPPGDSILILAFGIFLAALGWAFSWYLLPVAVPITVLAIRRELKMRRQRISA